MSRVGNQWTTADGSILRFRDEPPTQEKVDTARFPFSAQVDGLVYHSNMPRVALGGRMIDLTKPLTEEDQAVLRQTIPKTKSEVVQGVQKDFKDRKAQQAEQAKAGYFKDSMKGQKQLFDKRYEQYLRNHPEQVAFEKIVGGLTKGADFIVDKAGSVLPFVSDIYKRFAPTGSQFYQAKSIEQKLAEVGKAKVGDLGKKLIG